VSSPEPIKVPVDMPRRVDDATAVAMFLLDLQRSGAVWNRNPRRGCHTAMLAAVRFLHAVGSPGLTLPFRVMGEGLADLGRGRVPPIFEPVPHGKATDSAKTTAEMNLSVEAACFLDALIRGAGMNEKKAAEALAKILDKKGLRVSRQRNPKPTARTIIGLRKELARPGSQSSAGAREKYFFCTEDLLADLQAIPDRDRQGHLLGVFCSVLVEHEAIRLKTPPYDSAGLPADALA
jgi:hypothetical protein